MLLFTPVDRGAITYYLGRETYAFLAQSKLCVPFTLAMVHMKSYLVVHKRYPVYFPISIDSRLTVTFDLSRSMSVVDHHPFVYPQAVRQRTVNMTVFCFGDSLVYRATRCGR